MKMKLETTLNLLEQNGMQQDKIDLLVEKLGKNYGKDKPFNFLIFLEVFPDYDGIDIFVEYFSADAIIGHNETINNFASGLIFNIFMTILTCKNQYTLVSECHEVIRKNLSWD